MYLRYKMILIGGNVFSSSRVTDMGIVADEGLRK
jgi:hypothetical protein